MLYSDPELYDLAFGHRDIAAECTAILEIAGRFGVARPRRVLEIACGPAHHLRELARRGLAGVGVDKSAAMLRYARALSKRDRVALDLQRGDMRTFAISGKADIALCLYDSFVYCATDADAIAVLRATAKALRPSGVLILELAHPADFFNFNRPHEKRTLSQWTRPLHSGKMRTRFSITEIDAVEEMYVAKVEIDVFDKRGRVVKRFRDRLRHKMWLRSSIDRVARSSDAFEIAGSFGALDPDVPLSMGEEAHGMVLALRRITRAR